MVESFENLDTLLSDWVKIKYWTSTSLEEEWLLTKFDARN